MSGNKKAVWWYAALLYFFYGQLPGVEREVSPRFRSGLLPAIISAAPSADELVISEVYTSFFG